MIKNALAIGAGVGVVAGVLIGCWLYRKMASKKEQAQRERRNTLYANRTIVERLTSSELSSWFRNHRKEFSADAKMLVVKPTAEHLKGFGFGNCEPRIDPDTNILQMFADKDVDHILKSRLITYTNIDPNLDVQLIERSGIIIITD